MVLASESQGWQSERPILPPIRDLFPDINKSSPHLTHAQLRVSEHDGFQPCAPSPLSNNTDIISNRGYESYHGKLPVTCSCRYCYSDPSPPLLHRHPPRHMWPHDMIIPDKSSISPDIAPADTYYSKYPHEHRALQYRTEDRTSSDYCSSPTGSLQAGDYVSKLPSCSREISTVFPPVYPIDDEQNTRHAVEESNSTGPSKYECSYCRKNFSRPSSLKIHLNSHTGEKPFICPVDTCGRSFSVLSNMRRHARVHSQIPP